MKKQFKPAQMTRMHIQNQLLNPKKRQLHMRETTQHADAPDDVMGADGRLGAEVLDADGGAVYGCQPGQDHVRPVVAVAHKAWGRGGEG
jgi:hypothetical protein